MGQDQAHYLRDLAELEGVRNREKIDILEARVGRLRQMLSEVIESSDVGAIVLARARTVLEETK